MNGHSVDLLNGSVFDAPPGTRLFVCGDCGFAFDAAHTDDGTDGEYTCPVCEVEKLKKELSAREGVTDG